MTRAASPGPALSIRNDCSRWRSAPIKMLAPTSPLAMIMTAANMASRASAALSSPPASIIDTISEVSIAVTARARTSVPNGSPTRWATTSA